MEEGPAQSFFAPGTVSAYQRESITRSSYIIMATSAVRAWALVHDGKTRARRVKTRHQFLRTPYIMRAVAEFRAKVQGQSGMDHGRGVCAPSIVCSRKPQSRRSRAQIHLYPTQPVSQSASQSGPRAQSTRRKVYGVAPERFSRVSAPPTQPRLVQYMGETGSHEYIESSWPGMLFQWAAAPEALRSQQKDFAASSAIGASISMAASTNKPDQVRKSQPGRRVFNLNPSQSIHFKLNNCWRHLELFQNLSIEFCPASATGGTG